jgi:preprotein translocase subunit SecD
MQMKVVDDGSTRMQQLCDRVPIDKPKGIDANIDRWRADDGRTHADCYLTGSSPDAIEAYVAGALPADRELAFQQIDGARWRTYLVFPAIELDATAVSHAHASTDPQTQRPTVTLDFTPAGARTFGDLTGRIAGHKLAVLVDGHVVSAPVINDAITGAHAVVTLDPTATDVTATALARALESR